jgi:hypothetical protein
MKKNLLKIYEGFFDNITDDLDKLNPNQDDGFGDVNSGIYDEHDFILSPYKNPEFFIGLCNFCKDHYPDLPSNENGFTQEDLDKITYLDDIKGYFDNVTSLNELHYFHNLEKIFSRCFYNCPKLKSIIFPKNLKFIRKYSFSNCDSLEEIIFPKNISNIEYFSFAWCYKLKKITIPEKFKYKLEDIFYAVYLKKKINITYI